MYLYLDIETIPGQRPDIKETIAAGITPPANYTKPETIARWEAETKPVLIGEALERAGLRGETGEVVAIGWAWDDETVNCAYRSNLSPESEKGALEGFAEAMKSLSRIDGIPCIVGHFVSGFDIRYIWQRCVVHGIKLPRWWPLNGRPWDDEHVYDTMIQWAGVKGSISQDNLCLALGIPPKQGMNGAMVWPTIQQGGYERVAQYCMDDVRRVRAIHRKMTFQPDLGDVE